MIFGLALTMAPYHLVLLVALFMGLFFLTFLRGFQVFVFRFTV